LPAMLPALPLPPYRELQVVGRAWLGLAPLYHPASVAAAPTYHHPPVVAGACAPPPPRQCCHRHRAVHCQWSGVWLGLAPLHHPAIATAAPPYRGSPAVAWCLAGAYLLLTPLHRSSRQCVRSAAASIVALHTVLRPSPPHLLTSASTVAAASSSSGSSSRYL
jgi:hypothetical protein